MTKTTTTQPEKGTVLHALATLGLGGRLIQRGMTFTVDDALLKNDLDREGRSSLAAMIDAGRLGYGDFESTGLEPWEQVGDNLWTALYVKERDAANAIPSPYERDRAKAALHERFGFPPVGWLDPTPHRSKWSY